MNNGAHSDRTWRPSLVAIAMPLGLIGLCLLYRFGWSLLSLIA